MQYSYKTKGTCSRKIDFSIENGVINEIHFMGGCDGNLKGLSSLVKGMSADDVIERLEGIKCGFRKTSCPDQLAKALKDLRGEESP